METSLSRRPRRINFYGGPGTGKSTITTAVFAFLKMLGCNIEYVPEYAKDATWERRGEKVFKAQDYLFGKQHFRLQRLHEEVEFVVTDSPILMSDVYLKKYHGDGYVLPSLSNVIREAHAVAENLDIFIVRNKPYNPNGRNQDEAEARELDELIRELLQNESPGHIVMEYGRERVDDVAQKLIEIGWIPDFTRDQLQEMVNYHTAMLHRYGDMLDKKEDAHA